MTETVKFTHPIPVDVLRQLLRLDPETGRLYWLPRGMEWFNHGRYSAQRNCAIWNTRYSGKEAFTASDQKGYRRGDIFKRRYPAQRVVFALANGRWPEGDTDHRDGGKGNNRPENLREATRQQNCHNTGSKGGTSRYVGVCWHRLGKKWMARCRDAAGTPHYLGLFPDEISAARARDAFASEHHGEFARLNFSTEGSSL